MKIIRNIILIILVCIFLSGCSTETKETKYVYMDHKTYKLTVTISSPGNVVESAFFSPDFSQIGANVSIPFIYTTEIDSAGYLFYYAYKNQNDGTLVMSISIDDKPIADVATSKSFRVEELRIEGFIIDKSSEQIFFPAGVPDEIDRKKQYPDILYWDDVESWNDIRVIYP